jgi:hypothetical protein
MGFTESTKSSGYIEQTYLTPTTIWKLHAEQKANRTLAGTSLKVKVGHRWLRMQTTNSDPILQLIWQIMPWDSQVDKRNKTKMDSSKILL